MYSFLKSHHEDVKKKFNILSFSDTINAFPADVVSLRYHLFSSVPSEMRDSGLTVLHTKQDAKLKRKYKGHQMMEISHWLKF